MDAVLDVLKHVGTGFYLTGGTAASRAYLNHRYSNDLDFFVNDDPAFGLWADRFIQALRKPLEWSLDVVVREERFVRCSVVAGDVALRLEMVNDVPSHVGDLFNHPVLGRIDSAENILANKVTALMDRNEPKDLADVWAFCCRLGVPLDQAITDAQSKAAGIFPADLARVLCSASHADWELVQWIEAPSATEFLADLRALGEKLIL